MVKLAAGQRQLHQACRKLLLHQVKFMPMLLPPSARLMICRWMRKHGCREKEQKNLPHKRGQQTDKAMAQGNQRGLRL